MPAKTHLSSVATVAMLLRPEQAPYVIDGGFHVGKYTQNLREYFPDATVVGFEPDPATYRKAVQVNDLRGLTLINAALGAEETTAEFFRGSFSATNSLLPRPHSSAPPFYPEAATLEGGLDVSVRRVDDVIRNQRLPRVDLLKLDLQGGELAALQGARKTLETGQVGVIQCEVVFVRKYQNQPMFWEICNFLSLFGYELHSFAEVKVGPYDKDSSAVRQATWNQADAIFLSPHKLKQFDIAV